MPNSEANKFPYALANLNDAAKWVISKAKSSKIWCFEGQMGAGKTTLLAQVCRQLGVQSEINSPSFSLVNEYQISATQKVFHFDFYRIKNIEEVYDIGFEAYFDSGHICLIEWPEKIQEILVSEPHLVFHLKGEGAARTISIQG